MEGADADPGQLGKLLDGVTHAAMINHDVTLKSRDIETHFHGFGKLEYNKASTNLKKYEELCNIDNLENWTGKSPLLGSG
jgi:hypothetical protein